MRRPAPQTALLDTVRGLLLDSMQLGVLPLDIFDVYYQGATMALHHWWLLAVHDASSCILFPTFCDSTGICKQSVCLSRSWSRIVSPSVWGAPQKSKPSLVVTMLLVLYVVVGTASSVVGKMVTLLWDLTCRMQPVRCV